MLLALWGETIYRPTRDLDFAGYGSSLPNDIRSAICDVCAVPVADDGIVFNNEALTIEPIRGQDEYDGLRAGFGATLDGAQIRMRVDIGFGNAIQPPPIDAHYPVLLDAPRPRIRVYPREAVVAEKLHAMVNYGERNSRFKDFYDLHALAQHFEFDGESLVHAIGATFERRRTPIPEEPPVALTPRFYADAVRVERWRPTATGTSCPQRHRISLSWANASGRSSENRGRRWHAGRHSPGRGRPAARGGVERGRRVGVVRSREAREAMSAVSRGTEKRTALCVVLVGFRRRGRRSHGVSREVWSAMARGYGIARCWPAGGQWPCGAGSGLENDPESRRMT